jgi:glutamate synthase domain-containing protein 1
MSTMRAVAENPQASRAVVDKACTLLEAWNHRGEALGSSELARRTGLPKSTSHRLLCKVLLACSPAPARRRVLASARRLPAAA